MVHFCQEKGIPFKLCGKVIVALTESELPRLDNLYQRGMTNGVQGLEIIGPERLREIEPYAAGIKAIYSPNTGIVDYKQVARTYADDVQRGGEIVTGCQVSLIRRGVPAVLELHHMDRDGLPQHEIEADQIITCGGLQSDRLARMTHPRQGREDTRIIPFRGDYYGLRPEKCHMVRALIYPVPDPSLPFLGVHFTRLLSGDVWAGPNAVLAFAREGYRRSDVNLKDVWDVLSYPAFWKMAARYWRAGLWEMYCDLSKSAYVKALQRYMPDIQADDLTPGPSGVRAQALAADGRLVDDFVILRRENIVHIQNAPSPAATSSLPIARMIVEEATGTRLAPPTTDD
jgi:L-2-hydroxyglutarate oxidase